MQKKTAMPYNIVHKQGWGQPIEFMAVTGRGCGVIEARHSKERKQNE